MQNDELNKKYKEFDEYIDSFEKKDDYLPILLKAQDIFGYLSTDVQFYISERLNIVGEELQRIIKTNRLKEKPTGEYEIKLCVGLHCKRKGYDDVLEEFERVLNIKVGEVTEDGKFSLDVTGCRGSCRQALAVTVNRDMHRNVTKEDVKRIIESYK